MRDEVLVHVNANHDDPEDMLVTLDEQTIEKAYAWIFFYQSKTFVETGDPSFQLVGNGPIVFMRESASIHMLGTARPIEEEIEGFERHHVPLA